MKGLGHKIKTLRKFRKLTLVEVSKKTGIDPATLSRIENGVMIGTVDSHARIAQSLGIQLPELYGDILEKIGEEKARRIQAKLSGFSHASGAVSQLLTTNVMGKKMMPTLVRVKAGGHTEQEQFPLFTERFFYVVKGKFEVTLPNEKRELNEGESLYFDGSQPHRFDNIGKVEGLGVSVITPASL